MALRACLPKNLESFDGWSSKAIGKAVDHIKKTIPRWTTSLEQADLWIYRTVRALGWCVSHWDDYVSNVSEEKVGLHILAFEAFTECQDDNLPLPSIFDGLTVEAERPVVIPPRPAIGTVVFITGPIGSGKSTIAKQICNLLSDGIMVERDLFPLGKEGSNLFRKHLNQIFSSGKKLIIVSMQVVPWMALSLAKSYGYQKFLIYPSDGQGNLHDECLERVISRKDHATIKDDKSPEEISGIINSWWENSYALPEISDLIEKDSFDRVLKASFLGKSFSEDVLNFVSQNFSAPMMISPDTSRVDYFHLPCPKTKDFKSKVLSRRPQNGNVKLHGVTLLHRTLFAEFPHLFSTLLHPQEIIVTIDKIIVTTKGGVAKIGLKSKSGQPLNHLVSSGIPHITLWVMEGIEPVEMGPESLRTAEQEDVVEHRVQNLSFTSTVEIVWRRV
jgi:ABC-type oligopeptide transport system ATPase subunit